MINRIFKRYAIDLAYYLLAIGIVWSTVYMFAWAIDHGG